MTVVIPESVTNFLYFLVGLAIGFYQIWQNQKYFQAQQQDKFNRITDEVTKISEKLAMISEVVSERAQAREDRLFSMASPQREALEVANKEAAADVRSVVVEELKKAGIADAAQRTSRLEQSVNRILQESSERVIRASEGVDDAIRVIRRIPPIARFLLYSLGREPFDKKKLDTLVSGGVPREQIERYFAKWQAYGLLLEMEGGRFQVRPEVYKALGNYVEARELASGATGATVELITK